MLSSAQPTLAEPPALLVDNNAFRIAFGMSFVAFDECGDPDNGRLFRKAVMEKFQSCPFNEAARKDLLEWTEKTETQFRQWWADGAPLRTDCAALWQYPPGYHQEMIDLLSRYSRGEVGFDAVMPGRCNMPAVPL